MFDILIADKNGRQVIKFRAKELFSVDLGDDYVLSLSRAGDNPSKATQQKGDFKADTEDGTLELRPRVDDA